MDLTLIIGLIVLLIVVVVLLLLAGFTSDSHVVGGRLELFPFRWILVSLSLSFFVFSVWCETDNVSI